MSDEMPADLAKIQRLLSDGRATLKQVHTFTHGPGWQVMENSRKVGPLLFPPEGGKTSDTLRLLADLMDDD